MNTLYAKLTSLIPSPWDEPVSGVITALLALGLLKLFALVGLFGQIALAGTAISLAYELKVDPNGFSKFDVAMREAGLLVAAFALSKLF